MCACVCVCVCVYAGRGTLIIVILEPLREFLHRSDVQCSENQGSPVMIGATKTPQTSQTMGSLGDYKRGPTIGHH